jgi:hypothetical protein
MKDGMKEERKKGSERSEVGEVVEVKGVEE